MPVPPTSKPGVASKILSVLGRTCVGLLSCALLLFLYILEVQREERRLAPPAGVGDVSGFSKSVLPPKRLTVVERGGSKYIIWYGELAGPLDLPSGPSCYVFDGTGALIDWQPETGEGGRVDAFLESVSKGHAITINEALEMTGERRR